MDILNVDERIIDVMQNLQHLVIDIEASEDRPSSQAVLTQKEVDANAALGK